MISISFMPVVSSQNNNNISDEYLVKLAFIYKMIIYVKWPEGVFSKPDDPVVFCILGKNPFKSAAKTVKNRTVKGKQIITKEIGSLRGVSSCNVLFVSQSEERSLGRVLKSPELEKSSILTIADMEDFSKKGGMISLIKEDRRVRFEINTEAVEKASIKISSQLLKLAKIVKTTKGF